MFRIGDFSRLSRVSVRMLRHYDARGLLKPARIDPQTDYRYYTADQLPRLNRLVALKELGFTLAQIARLLDDDLPVERLGGMLVLRRAEIEQRVEAEHARLAALESRLDQLARGEGRPDYDVLLRAIPPQPVAAIRDVLPTGAGIEPLFNELEAYVARHRVRAASPPLAIFHDAEYRERDLDMEVAVPISAALPASDRVFVGQIPALPAAVCVVHTGSYAGIADATNALLAWIEAHGYAIAGPLREVYLRFGAEGTPVALPPAFLTARAESFVTELQLPVARI